MRNVRRVLVVLCVVLSLGVGALWVTGRNAVNTLYYVPPPRTVGHEVRLVSSGGRIACRWERTTGGGLWSGWLAGRGAPQWPGEQTMAARSALHNFAGFGGDLGLYHVEVWGDVALPLWFLLALFAAYPAWRAYRRFRPMTRAHRFKGFEPVIESRQVNA